MDFLFISFRIVLFVWFWSMKLLKMIKENRALVKTHAEKAPSFFHHWHRFTQIHFNNVHFSMKFAVCFHNHYDRFNAYFGVYSTKLVKLVVRCAWIYKSGKRTHARIECLFQKMPVEKVNEHQCDGNGTNGRRHPYRKSVIGLSNDCQLLHWKKSIVRDNIAFLHWIRQ